VKWQPKVVLSTTTRPETDIGPDTGTTRIMLASRARLTEACQTGSQCSRTCWNLNRQSGNQVLAKVRIVGNGQLAIRTAPFWHGSRLNTAAATDRQARQSHEYDRCVNGA
jgi:hypothetical protein